MSTLTQLSAWYLVGGFACYVLLGHRRWITRYLVLPAAISLGLEVAIPHLSAVHLPDGAWWLLIPLCLFAPVVVLVIGFRLLIGVMRIFGHGPAEHFGGELLAHLFLGRRHGRPIPERRGPNDA